MGMQSNNQNLSEQNPETSIYDNLLQSNIKKWGWMQKKMLILSETDITKAKTRLHAL